MDGRGEASSLEIHELLTVQSIANRHDVLELAASCSIETATHPNHILQSHTPLELEVALDGPRGNLVGSRIEHLHARAAQFF
jgi:hypothetical protein